MILTEAQLADRFITLTRELNDATDALVAAERAYYDAKATYEIAVSRAVMQVGERYANKGVKATVQEREAEATLMTANELQVLYGSEAVVRGMRANVNRINTHIDIARSMSALTRSAMSMA